MSATPTETSWCPNHGTVRVGGHGVTRGPDPYDVEKLACGCWTVWLSADRADCVAVRTGQRTTTASAAEFRAAHPGRYAR